MSVLRRLADARNTVEGKFLAVLMAAVLAVSMCGMPAWADTKADAGQTSAAAEKPANPVISLSLGNGYLVYGAGQIVKAPATKVTAMAGRDFKFVPEADKGYKVASVSLSVQGTQLDLYPNSFGEYVIPAAKLAGGAHLTLVTEKVSTSSSSAPRTTLNSQSTMTPENPGAPVSEAISQSGEITQQFVTENLAEGAEQPAGATGTASTKPAPVDNGTVEVSVNDAVTLNSDRGDFAHAWTSSNKDVAVVAGERGVALVNSMAEGTAVITHTYAAYGEDGHKWKTQSETWTVKSVASQALAVTAPATDPADATDPAGDQPTDGQQKPADEATPGSQQAPAAEPEPQDGDDEGDWPMPKQPTITITYAFHNNEGAPLDKLPEPYVATGKEGMSFVPSSYVKPIEGYVVVDVPESVEFGTEDVTLTVTYHRDANGNGTPDCREYGASVRLDSWTYGDTSNSPVAAIVPSAAFTEVTAADFPGKPAIAYRDRSAAAAEWVEDKPHDAGDYEVRATWQSEKYGEVTATQQFSIYPRAITLTSASDAKEYDGTELSKPEVNVTEGSWAYSEGADYDVTGSITEVGEVENAFTYTLKDNTKASNYTITCVNGKLTVTKAGTAAGKLTVFAASAQKYYDGTPLTAGYAYEGPLAEGDTLEVATEGTITNVGTAENKITSLSVVNADGADVTANYNIEASSTPGTLTVVPREVVLASASDYKIYDGEPLTNHDVTVGGKGWPEGEGATVEVTGTQTEVGSSENTITYTLNEGMSADNYRITLKPGTLTVGSADAVHEVSVVAKSSAVTYDGRTQVVEGFEGCEGTAAPTFTIEGETYTVSGLTAQASGTDAGEYAVNVTGTPQVTDSQGDDVTAQFNVKTVNGTLSIAKRHVVLVSADAVKDYDGEPLVNATVRDAGDGWAWNDGATYQVTGTQTAVGSSDNAFTYTLNANTKALVNATVRDAGDGWAWNDGATYQVTGTQTAVGSSDNAFTYTLNANTKASNYDIECLFGTLTVNAADTESVVTLIAKSETVKYDGTAHEVTGFRVKGSDDATFVVDGKAYTVEATVGAAGTDAGTYPAKLTGTPKITDADGNDATGRFAVALAPGAGLTIEKRAITLRAVNQEKVYDGTPLVNANPMPSLGGDGWAAGEGATYAFTGSQTLVGTSPLTFTYTLNANTKASNYDITTYPASLTVLNRDARFDVNVAAASKTVTYDAFTYTLNANTKASNYDITTYPASLTVLNRDARFDVNVAAASKTVTYDGADQVVTSLAGGQDYTIGAGDSVRTVRAVEVRPGGVPFYVTGLTVEGHGKDVGRYAIGVTGAAVVYDAQGNDVTEQFAVTTTAGELVIDKRPLTLVSAGIEKPYDGSPLTNGDTPLLIEEGWAAGEGATYVFSGSATRVNETVANAFEIVPDAGTSLDNYLLTKQEGDLRIVNPAAPHTLVVAANSATFTYDGEEHSVGGFPGEFVDQLGRTVVPAQLGEGGATFYVTVAANSATFTYDGEEHSVGGFPGEFVDQLGRTVVPAQLGEGGATFYVTGLHAPAITATNATEGRTGVVETDANVVVYDADGQVVTEMFNVKPEPGKLTISPRPVTFESPSIDKPYDGTPLVGDAAAMIIGGKGLVAGQEVEFTMTGSQTLAGSSDNSFTYVWKDGTNAAADNYAVTLKTGTLTVTKEGATSVVTLTIGSADATYDGQPHGPEGFEGERGSVSVPAAGGRPAYEAEGIWATSGSVRFLVNVDGYRLGDFPVNAGAYQVGATGAAVVFDENGNDVTDVVGVIVKPGAVTIAPREVSLESNSDAKVYDGTALTGTSVADVSAEGAGWVEGEEATFLFTSSQTNVGSVENRFDCLSNAATRISNYSIASKAGTLTIVPQSIDPAAPTEINPDDLTQAVYTGAEALPMPTLTYAGQAQEPVPTIVTANGQVLRQGADFALAYEGNTTNVGTAKAVATANPAGNFRGTVACEFEIVPAPARIIVNPAAKFFGDDDPAAYGGYAVDGLFGSDVLGTVTLTRLGDAEEAGTYPGVIDATVARQNGNYVVTGVERGAFTIAPVEGNALLLQNVAGADSFSKTYDGRPAVVRATALQPNSTIWFSADGTLDNWTTDMPDFVNAGTYQVYVQATHNNFEPTAPVLATVVINPAIATVAVDNATKVAGDNDPDFTGTVTGLVAGDELEDLAYVRTIDDEAIGTYPDALTATYYPNPNYSVRVVDGDFAITAPAAPLLPNALGSGPTPGVAPDDGPMASLAGILGSPFEMFVGDDETPLAETSIEDDATPQAAFDHPMCWVHFYMFLGIAVTAIYGAVCIALRLRGAREITDLENDLTAGGRRPQRATRPVRPGADGAEA